MAKQECRSGSIPLLVSPELGVEEGLEFCSSGLILMLMDAHDAGEKHHPFAQITWFFLLQAIELAVFEFGEQF